MNRRYYMRRYHRDDAFDVLKRLVLAVVDKLKGVIGKILSMVSSRQIPTQAARPITEYASNVTRDIRNIERSSNVRQLAEATRGVFSGVTQINNVAKNNPVDSGAQSFINNAVSNTKSSLVKCLTAIRNFNLEPVRDPNRELTAAKEHMAAFKNGLEEHFKIASVMEKLNKLNPQINNQYKLDKLKSSYLSTQKSLLSKFIRLMALVRGSGVLSQDENLKYDLEDTLRSIKEGSSVESSLWYLTKEFNRLKLARPALDDPQTKNSAIGIWIVQRVGPLLKSMSEESRALDKFQAQYFFKGGESLPTPS